MREAQQCEEVDAHEDGRAPTEQGFLGSCEKGRRFAAGGGPHQGRRKGAAATLGGSVRIQRRVSVRRVDLQEGFRSMEAGGAASEEAWDEEGSAGHAKR